MTVYQIILFLNLSIKYCATLKLISFFRSPNVFQLFIKQIYCSYLINLFVRTNDDMFENVSSLRCIINFVFLNNKLYRMKLWNSVSLIVLR